MAQQYDRKIFNKLFDAIDEGDVAEVQKILKDNPGKIDFTSEKGYRTPLTRVVESAAPASLRIGRVYNFLEISRAKKMLRALVEAGADINHEERGGLLPLHIAAADDEARLIPLLIELGADPNKRNKRDETALTSLFKARFHFEEKVCIELLKAGTDPDLRDAKGNNAYDCADHNDWGDEFRKAVKTAQKWLKKNPPVLRPKTVTLVTGPVPSATAKNLEALSRILQSRKTVPAAIEAGVVQPADVAAAVTTTAMPEAVTAEIPTESPQADPKNDGWIVLAPDRVAHETVVTALKLKITEIFNFATKQHILVTTDLERNIQSNSKRSFDQMDDPEMLKSAEDVLKKRGGTAAP